MLLNISKDFTEKREEINALDRKTIYAWRKEKTLMEQVLTNLP